MSSDATTRRHAEVGSSTIGYVAACPGWGRDGRPKSVHPVTESGTRCHVALETGDLSGLKEDVEFALVQMAQGYRKVLGSASWIRTYKELCVEPLPGDPSVFGYLDELGFVSDEEAHLIDWKFGWHRVADAEHNLQGWFLVLGCWNRFPDLQRIHVHFGMARVGKVTRHTFTRSADRDRLGLAVQAAIERRRRYLETRDAGMLAPAFETCLYCGVKWSCLKWIEAAATIAAGKGVEVPAVVDAKDTDDPATLSRLMDLATIMEDWAESTKWHVAQARFERGIEIPGFRVAERAAPRKITDPLTTFHKAVKFGVTPEQFAACSTLSVGKIEEVIRGAAPMGQKSKAVDRFFDELVDADAMEPEKATAYLKREDKR